MRRLTIVAVVLALAGGVVAGCGDDAPDTASTASHAAPAPAKTPTFAAKLACSTESTADIAVNLGVQTTAPLAPRWDGHTYACDYVYGDAVMTLSVADNASPGDATAAYTSGRPSTATDIPALGQAAYARMDGTAVVRKDSQILIVDVSKLPAQFGKPPHPRNIDAITVATVIMSCWTEG